MKEDIKNIVIKYNNGTEKVIEKGAVLTVKKNDEESETVTFECVDVSGEDFINIVFGVTKMGAKMGMFGEELKDNEDSLEIDKKVERIDARFEKE